MLLKALFLIALIYFVLRTIMNLVRAIWVEPQQTEILGNDPRHTVTPPHPASPSNPNSRRHQAEVEDAQWVDLG